MTKRKAFRLAIIMLLFTTISILKGGSLVADSETYIKGSLSRQGIYPIFLNINRLCFNEKYLFCVAIEESILAAVSMFVFVENISTFLYLSKKSIIWCYAIAVSQWLLISREDKCWYPVTIWPEAVTFSLYFIFATFLVKYYFTKQLRYAIGASAQICILYITKQTLLVFGAGFIVIFFMIEILNDNIASYGMKRRICRYFAFVMSFAFFFLLTTPVSSIYEKIFPYDNEEISFRYAQILQNAMYLSDETDRTCLNSDEEYMYDFCENICLEKQFKYSIHSSKYSGLELQNANAALYDETWIAFHCFKPITGYYSEKYNLHGYELSDYIQRVSINLSRKLIFRHWKQYLHIVSVRWLAGVYSSIWISPYRRWWVRDIALFIYMLYVLCISRVWNNKKIVNLALIVLFMISICALSTGMVIFLCVRYVYYNFAFFYIVLLYMIHEILAQNGGKVSKFLLKIIE